MLAVSCISRQHLHMASIHICKSFVLAHCVVRIPCMSGKATSEVPLARHKRRSVPPTPTPQATPSPTLTGDTVVGARWAHKRAKREKYFAVVAVVAARSFIRYESSPPYSVQYSPRVRGNPKMILVHCMSNEEFLCNFTWISLKLDTTFR